MTGAVAWYHSIDCPYCGRKCVAISQDGIQQARKQAEQKWDEHTETCDKRVIVNIVVMDDTKGA